jgi:hypothetical protein
MRIIDLPTGCLLLVPYNSETRSENGSLRTGYFEHFINLISSAQKFLAKFFETG